MRKAMLYLALAGCFLFALLLESVFTQSPRPDSETAAAVTLGAGRVVVVPEQPPEDWPPAPERTPRRGPRGNPRSPAPDPAPTPEEEEPTPTPPEDGPRRIVVKSGDSLWDLAEAHLGAGRHYKELARWNGLNPNAALPEGAVLRLQPAEYEPPSPTPTPGGRIESHVVKRGENLSEIAERYLGSARAWTRIRDLNHLPNDRVTEGMVLRIPDR